MTRPIEDILADAWRLRDELDAAAVDLSGQRLQDGPEGVLTAVQEATRALYLGDIDRNQLAHLVIRALDEDIYRILEERGAEAAYDAAHGREDDV